MNAAEQENCRNEIRALVLRGYEEVPLRVWEIQYKHKYPSHMNFTVWHGFRHLEEEVKPTLKHLRSKYPEYIFRAVKQITITYTKTIIRN